MISACEVVAELAAHEFKTYVGVPCSFLTPLINTVICDQGADYTVAANEGEAIAIAAGMTIAGTKSVMMCQNSGLGNAINPISSLLYPSKIPLLLMITLRGEPGIRDEPQHELMGQITTSLLDQLRIPWAVFPSDLGRMKSAVAEAAAVIAERRSFAFVLRKGCLSGPTTVSVEPPALNGRGVPSGEGGPPRASRIARSEAIRVIRETAGKESAFVATTGHIGRELYALGDAENQFYMVGSMGCAASFGLGIVKVRPRVATVVLDGDGAALMRLEAMATIGTYGSSGALLHVVLDNEMHESTGGQFTVAPNVDFASIACAAGYSRAVRCDGHQLGPAIGELIRQRGSSLVHVKVAPGHRASLPRPGISPAEAATRFSRFLSTSGSNS